jgi:pyruvate/2-oxoglutarate dehydrogenase complex dihydrolipoamide dehydrogenase (E3) component
MRYVDIAIIGAGHAGLNAVKIARQARASWVLINSGPLGTTCARVGCMPSKALIELSGEAGPHPNGTDLSTARRAAPRNILIRWENMWAGRPEW